jgi:hypothetical protein
VSRWGLSASSNKCLNGISCYNLHTSDYFVHILSISHAAFHFFLQKVDPLSPILFSSSEDFPLLFLDLVLKIVHTYWDFAKFPFVPYHFFFLRLPFGAIKFPSPSTPLPFVVKNSVTMIILQKMTEDHHVLQLLDKTLHMIESCLVERSHRHHCHYCCHCYD